MKLPTIRGVIDRRILVNFRIDPDVLSEVVPAPFRVQRVNGFGIAGICMIRFNSLRPKFLPAAMGMSSENAAHRIAVEWDTDDGIEKGVYVPRRDTSSQFNVFAGGRIFPGVQHPASFDVEETESRFRVHMQSKDASGNVLVDGSIAQCLPESSVFSSIDEVSEFFEQGSLGYSPNGDKFDAMELRSFNWSVEPLDVTEVHSSFFQPPVFPKESVEFDCALLMRGIDHEWHSREAMCCSG